ncbi:NADH-quinone oxidoreductase subunit J [soil metagenome]
MDIKTALFFIFSAVMLFAAFRVVTARSTVIAALFLVLSFFTASCIWILLAAEFLAITLVLVYVGAVMVLFLFVVMMLDIDVDAARQGFWKHFPLAAVVGVVIALEMAAVLLGGFNVSEVPAVEAAAAQLGNTKMLGIELYTNYLYPLEIAAVILLVAIVAAIALTLRRRKDAKGQNPSEQVKARKADRMRIVKMKSVVTMPATAVPAAAAGAPTAAVLTPTAVPGAAPAPGPAAPKA